MEIKTSIVPVIELRVQPTLFLQISRAELSIHGEQLSTGYTLCIGL